MDPQSFVDPCLTKPDLLVLQSLLQDIDDSKFLATDHPISQTVGDAGYYSQSSSDEQLHKTFLSKNDESTNDLTSRDGKTLAQMRSINDPQDKSFEPTVFVSWDLSRIKLPPLVDRYILQPYVRWGRTIVRNETDVVMLTHLILYFTTSVPSALYLYYHFSWLHGVLHTMMQVWYVGSYTLMMHQHIHMRGVLARNYAWFDHAFPYLTDPLMGHTWNSYYFHHVKHHHVEGNGPNDLSTTLRYQRDNIWHFLHYVGRFFFLVWLELPLYFFHKNQMSMAVKTAVFELGNYLFLYTMARRVHFRATIFVYLIPLLIMRIGLMIGNWGQHAFVDEIEPDSDFRSSITLIDVASNRFCFNDGYHTSHHLNPRRHWREHPISFLRQKHTYAKESALVFRNIDYLMITVRVLRKDYKYLAKCLVPMGDQVGMSLGEIEALLETKTRRFNEAEIQKKFQQSKFVQVQPDSSQPTIN